jgi:hypothetical protein
MDEIKKFKTFEIHLSAVWKAGQLVRQFSVPKEGRILSSASTANVLP